MANKLEPGAVIGNWRLIKPLKEDDPTGDRTQWLVQCISCPESARPQKRLAGHLRIGAQPGCGKCKSQGGDVAYAGAEAKRRVAARAGVEISDEEAWAFENCDYDPRARRIVARIIKRETAILRRKKQQEELERFMRMRDLEEREIRQYRPVEYEDGDY